MHSAILRCFVGVPFKIHCLILTRGRQPHNDSATLRNSPQLVALSTLGADFIRIVAFQLLAEKSCAPEMELIWQAFGSQPKGWPISRRAFRKILGFCTNLTQPDTRGGKDVFMTAGQEEKSPVCK